VTGTLTLSGNLLGTDTDDVQIAFYRDGAVLRVIDIPAPVSNQTLLTVNLPTINPLAAGSYRLICRVNGQQARNSPMANLP
jgi:hypothetical protein